MSSLSFVPFDYQMDPKQETLLYGDELKNGMVVLIEGYTRANPANISREEFGSNSHAYLLNELNTTARWCVVTKLRVQEREKTNPLVTFIGVYHDGTMTVRRYDSSFGWFVKKASFVAFDGTLHGVATATSMIELERAE